MKMLSDNVTLGDAVNSETMRDALVEAVNVAWKAGDKRCNVPASFIAWLIQEYDRLRARANENTAP